MNFEFIGTWQYWGVAAVVSLVALLLVLFRKPWRFLVGHSARQHGVVVAALALALFWLLRVNIEGLLQLHPLLIMSIVMVFGVELAILIGTLSLIVIMVVEGAGLAAMIMPHTFTVVIPALTAHLVLELIRRSPSRNLFVYMLGGGFFGSMLTVQTMALAQLGYIALFGPGPLWVIAIDHYYLCWLMMFPEGFINGAIVTTLTVLAPQWVKTYDDHRYLDDQ